MSTETNASKIQSEEMIDPRLIVKFRPAKGWEGEYGFDWYRENDYFEEGIGRSSYGELIGKYVAKDPDQKKDPEDPVMRYAKYNKDKEEGERSSDDCLLQLKKEYDRRIIKGLNVQYYVPSLSLFYNKPDKNHSNIKIKPDKNHSNIDNQSKVEKVKEWGPTRVPISIIAVSDKANDIQKIVNLYLEFVCDEGIYVDTDIKIEEAFKVNEYDGKKYFNIGYAKHDPNTKTCHRWDFDLDVISEFEDSDSSVGNGKTIKVYAKTIDEINNNMKGTFAGQLNIIFRKVKTIDICMVHVRIGGSGQMISAPYITKIEEGKKNLRKYLAQAHIIPNFISDRILNIDRSQLNRFFSETGREIIRIKAGELLDKFIELINQEDGTVNEEIFQNAYKFFFIEEGCEGGVVGRAHRIGEGKAVIIFKGSDSYGDTSTEIHELLHCLGLYHSFSNRSKHTFKKEKTTNIMDYSSDAYSLWKWQWEQIRNALGLKYISTNKFKK